MLLIELQLNDNELISEIDGYSMGHITIRGDKGVISSRKSAIDQSMMIFLAATDLLDGYRMFIDNKHEVTYNFVGCDSSFQFYLTKQKPDKIIIESSQEAIIEEVEQSEFADALWKSSNIFFDIYCHFLEEKDLAKDDFKNALKDFASYFNLT